MSDIPSPTVGTGPTSYIENDIYKNADYKPVLSNWFTAKPYGFRFTPKKGDPKVMYLPIGPSNLNISTHFATNLIPTIAGTVEEHSPVRYYDITIEGTTGMAPKFIEPAKESPPLEHGRSSFTIQQTLSAQVEGFFSKTLSAGQNVFNMGQEIGGLLGRSAITGVYLNQTGYLAFHNLYRFFLQYKKDVAGVKMNSDGTTSVDETPRQEGTASPLVFFNHKDNNEYSVVIKSFTLRRDKEHPMMYFYSISMRGYNLRSLKGTTGTEAIAKSAELLAHLGLDGVKGSTFLGQAKETMSLARDILGSVSIGVNQLGR